MNAFQIMNLYVQEFLALIQYIFTLILTVGKVAAVLIFAVSLLYLLRTAAAATARRLIHRTH